MKLPTKKQIMVARAYMDFEERHGYKPTYEEIGNILGVAPSVIYNHVRRLEKIGCAAKDGNKKVSIIPLWSYKSEPVTTSSDINDQEFMKACSPLIDYLQQYHNPHTVVVVDTSGAEVLYGIKLFSHQSKSVVTNKDLLT